MSAHTPGPWAVGPGNVVRAGRYNVCPTVTAGGSSKGMIDEREVIAANARLIAAAPDLLLLIKVFWNGTNFIAVSPADRDAINACIGKATGAQP